MDIDAINAALRALLSRGGRGAICEAFLDGVMEDSGVIGVHLELPDEGEWSRGPRGGRRFPLQGIGGWLSIEARPPVEEREGRGVAALLDQLLLADQRAQQRTEARVAEVRSLVHDGRSLLAVMLGHCEILETGLGGELTARQRKSVASIKRQVERCEQLLGERRGRLVDPEW